VYLSCQNQSIQFCKSDCLVLDTGHVRPLHRVLVRFYWTCPVLLLDLSDLLSEFSVFFKIFIFGLSLPSILIYVIMWNICGAEIGSGLLIRKVRHELSLYAILSKVIFYQFLEEVQTTKIHSSNLRSHLPKILPDSLLKIFILSNPYQGVGPKFLEEKFSRVYQGQNNFCFSEKNLILCGLYPKLDRHSIAHCFQAFQTY
jgi:hypothetical protein